MSFEDKVNNRLEDLAGKAKEKTARRRTGTTRTADKKGGRNLSVGKPAEVAASQLSLP